MYTKYLVNNSKKNKSWLENQTGEVRVEGARGPGGQGARGPGGQGVYRAIHRADGSSYCA